VEGNSTQNVNKRIRKAMAMSTHILGALSLKINTGILHLFCSKYRSLNRRISSCPVFSI
jgi:hypothetical protein